MLCIPLEVAGGPTGEHTLALAVWLRLKANSLAETTRPHEGKFTSFPLKLSRSSFKTMMNSIEMAGSIYLEVLKTAFPDSGGGWGERLSLRLQECRHQTFSPDRIWFRSSNIVPRN